MGIGFWIRRFITVLVGAFAVIGTAQWLEGHPPVEAAAFAAAWATIAATIFTGSRLYQSRRGQHCALCRDTPAMRAGDDACPVPAERTST